MFKNLFLPSPSVEERKALKKTGLLQVIICYVLYILSMGAGFYLFRVYFLREAPNSGPTVSGVLVSYTLAALLCLLYIFTAGRRTPKSLGMQKKGCGRGYVLGILLSTGCLALILVPNLLMRTVHLSPNPGLQPAALLLLLIGFIFQGFMEEFLLRGLIFIEIAKKYGVFWGIFGNSLIFAMGHMGN